MSLLHPGHDHHRVPFEDMPDPYGDRAALTVEVGRLRRRLNQTEDDLAAVTAERDRLRNELERRRWWKW